MLDSGTLSNVPCANNELKIDTFDELDELLCTVEERDLAAFRRVNFIYNIDDGDLDIDWLELCTARFLGTLPCNGLDPSCDSGYALTSTNPATFLFPFFLQQFLFVIMI
jgi:hypothetical protein